MQLLLPQGLAFSLLKTCYTQSDSQVSITTELLECRLSGPSRMRPQNLHLPPPQGLMGRADSSTMLQGPSHISSMNHSVLLPSPWSSLKCHHHSRLCFPLLASSVQRHVSTLSYSVQNYNNVGTEPVPSLLQPDTLLWVGPSHQWGRIVYSAFSGSLKEQHYLGTKLLLSTQLQNPREGVAGETPA